MFMKKQESKMNDLHVTVKDGLAIIHTKVVDGCLTTTASIAKAIKPMSTKELSVFYKSLTHKDVKRFASKGDAAIRIHKFISPTGNGTKSGPAIKKKAKAPDGGSGKKFKAVVAQKAKASSIKNKTIHTIDHEKKTFQSGSVRGDCYQLVMDNAERKKLSVEAYLGLTAKNNIAEATALACLKKLCQTGQKVQTMELV